MQIWKVEGGKQKSGIWKVEKHNWKVEGKKDRSWKGPNGPL